MRSCVQQRKDSEKILRQLFGEAQCVKNVQVLLVGQVKLGYHETVNFES